MFTTSAWLTNRWMNLHQLKTVIKFNILTYMHVNPMLNITPLSDHAASENLKEEQCSVVLFMNDEFK